MTRSLPQAASPGRTPKFHLPDELLLGYANGSLEQAEALLVAVHASLCAVCAGKVDAFERVGGVLLSAAPEAPVSDDLLLRTLAQLDTRKLALPPTQVRDRVLPAPLARLTGPFEDITWKKSLPNTHTLELPISLGGVPVRLRRFRAGTTIPMHTHSAPEYDLILTGGVTDHSDGRHMVRGDVSANDERHAHSLTIDPGEECVALSVHNARVKPIGLWSRLVFGYTGW
jgi:putative transcriptional regulator